MCMNVLMELFEHRDFSVVIHMGCSVPLRLPKSLCNNLLMKLANCAG